MVIWLYIATTYLFISSTGVHLVKFTPFFATFQLKLPIIFPSPWGAPPGYAYVPDALHHTADSCFFGQLSNPEFRVHPERVHKRHDSTVNSENCTDNQQ